MTRMLIAGWPRVGKTWLAAKLAAETGAPVRHTDDTIPLGWSESSLAVSTWLEDPGPWVTEGVSIPRALRKWLDRNSEGTPADVIYWSSTPREDLSPGQTSMGKGCDKVWAEVLGELLRRGVRVEHF